MVNPMSETSNNSGKIVGLVVILVVVIGGLIGAWYFLMYKPEQAAKEKARQEQLAKAEAEKKRQEQLSKDKVKFDQLIKDADAAFEQENWQEAKSKYSEASSLFPNEQKPKDQLSIVNAKLAELAELEARRAAGIVERVEERTGRFYVIVSSSIDEDLALDYANKLAKEGNIAKIIRHETDKHIFFRVSLADFDSKEQADASVGNFTSYGEDVWVLPY
ncbi:MAG: hypothetical protein CMP48_24600 [Rickettsiales bacterium]|nr:hypothetical protein [Rickettsiales bacterium]